MNKIKSFATAIIRRASSEDISFTVRLISIGVFFVLVAITYSLIYRGSVKIDVKAAAAVSKNQEAKK